MTLFRRSPEPFAILATGAAPATLALPLRRKEERVISGYGRDAGDYRLLVEDGLDFATSERQIEAMVAELPAVLRLRPLDIAVVKKIEENDDGEIGGITSLRKRFILLADLGPELSEGRRYVFEHEASHLLLDGSSLVKGLLSAALTTAWNQIMNADAGGQEQFAQLREQGITTLQLWLEDGHKERRPIEVLLPLSGSFITAYAGNKGHSRGLKNLEDMAESLSLYLLDRRRGGLPVVAAKSLSAIHPVEFVGSAGLPMISLYPNRVAALDKLCSYQPKGGDDGGTSWLKAAKCLTDDAKQLRRHLAAT